MKLGIFAHNNGQAPEEPRTCPSLTPKNESHSTCPFIFTKALDWHHIKPLHLSPYSPDFNPIERLWQPLKSHCLAGFVTKRSEELADKLEVSIKQLLSLPETLKSVCRTHSDLRQKILAKGLGCCMPRRLP